MKKSKVFLIIIILIASFYSLDSYAVTPEDLRQSIEAKSQALQKINDEIRDTQQKLDATSAQKTSLQKELKTIDYNVSQLNLNIQSSEIKIDKLGLELESLQYDIIAIQKSSEVKKGAIKKFIQILYEKDREGILALVLQHKSLADSFMETQNIANLNNGLTIELNNLRALNLELEQAMQITTGKKQNIEIENKNLKNRKVIVQDQKNERQNLLAQTKNQEKLFNNLIDDLAKKQAEISAEIEKVEEELRKNIDPSLLPIPRPGVLAMSVTGILTQEYGATAFARNGYRGQFHNGIDIGAPIGTEIRSAEKGKVVAVGDQDQFCYRGAYGKFIVIAHDNNLTTLYAHLSKIAVNKDDIVERGALIGYVGRTGYATGPHLHLTVYAGPTFYMGASRVCGPMPFGGYLNPLEYLDVK
ncbi:MAG: peptidoglycan DD-metalloendopeptidase family protein [Candidatus Harrisonbacteria bacterium]|nr:peptidoglycan DD-metalloendopeptidase family protein [Candidatus Harrisonbacteria bacterium]